MKNPFKAPLDTLENSCDGVVYLLINGRPSIGVACSLKEAQFIAHAVNSHDELLAALKMAAYCMGDCVKLPDINKVKAAIAKAEARP